MELFEECMYPQEQHPHICVLRGHAHGTGGGRGRVDEVGHAPVEGRSPLVQLAYQQDRGHSCHVLHSGLRTRDVHFVQRVAQTTVIEVLCQVNWKGNINLMSWNPRYWKHNVALWANKAGLCTLMNGWKMGSGKDTERLVIITFITLISRRNKKSKNDFEKKLP